MAFVTIDPPAGIFANGTMYQGKGRWRDSNLIRFEEGEIKPVPGWQKRSGASAVSGAARALLSWRDNSNSRWIAIGTHSNLYVQDEAGTNHDVTPSGFTSGRADASQNLGYGGGAYGTGYYGTPRPNTVAYLGATTWSLDAWGQNLVGCSDTDGKIYQWSLNTSSAAAAISGAPTGNAGIVVTEQGFLFALGAGGDGRKVQWCDQQDNTSWSSDATNQAGDYDLPTVGTLQCGKAIPGGALLFTDVDTWMATYIGTPLVFGFERRGSGCGPISKGAVATRDSIAAWMGRGGFWYYDGQAVTPLDCEVHKAIYDDLNTSQISKITAVHIADRGEVWWFYPSASASENDSYVTWGYRESARLGRNIWTRGSLARLAGTGRGVFPNPIMVDAGGYVYEHETGLNYDGAEPYIETGPLEIGQGDTMGEVQRIIPDELQDGDVSATVFGQMWSDSADTTYGPVSLSSPTDLLLQARQIRIRFTGASASIWRVGNTRLDIVPGDMI